jgi:hypothetical protein
MPEDTHAKRLASLATQVFLDALGLLDTVIEGSKQGRIVLLPRCDFLWERKLQSTQHMPDGSVGIAQTISNEELALSLRLVALEHALEEAQELGNAVLAEVRRLLHRLLLLILIVLHDGNGVVRVMSLVVEVQRRQSMRQDPRLLRLVCAAETQFIAEVGEDGWSLVEQQRGAVLAFAGDAQGGWGEGGWVTVGACGG